MQQLWRIFREEVEKYMKFWDGWTHDWDDGDVMDHLAHTNFDASIILVNYELIIKQFFSINDLAISW